MRALLFADLYTVLESGYTRAQFINGLDLAITKIEVMEKFLALIAVSFGKKATVYAIGKVSFTLAFFNIS